MISGRADSIGAGSITTHTNGIRYGRPPGSAGSGLPPVVNGTNGAGSWPSGGADASPAFNSAMSSVARFGSSSTMIGPVAALADLGGPVSGRPDRRLNSAGSTRSYGAGMGLGFRGDTAGLPGLNGSGLGPGMGARGSEAGMSKVWPMNTSVRFGCGNDQALEFLTVSFCSLMSGSIVPMARTMLSLVRFKRVWRRCSMYLVRSLVRHGNRIDYTCGNGIEVCSFLTY